MIYLDNAATTLQKPPRVVQAVADAMLSAGNSGRGAHDGSLNAARIIYDARCKLAELLGAARPEQVAFTANATEALNTAIFGLLGAGDHVITTELEHNSVLRPLYRLQTEQGMGLDILPTDDRGNPILEKLPDLLKPNTKAVVCTHASNLTGNPVDLQAVRAFTEKHGLLLIVDGAQTAGSLPVSAGDMDVLCFSGHKGLLGPQGTGGLCVKEGLDIRPLKVGGSGVQSHSPTHPTQMPTRLEAGTLNTHGIAGLSAAADYLLTESVEKIHERELALTREFYHGVKDIPGITVYGDFRGDRAAVVALNVGDTDSGEVADLLFRRYDIATRSGAHCAPLMHRALGTEKQGAVRFSFSPFTTREEIGQAVQALAQIAGELR